MEAGEEATPPAVATSLQPQTPFVPASSCLPPAACCLLPSSSPPPSPSPPPAPVQNPNSIWMPANAKFVCSPNSWPFLLFSVFSSCSSISFPIPSGIRLAKAIGARGNNNQIKWHPELHHVGAVQSLHRKLGMRL